MTTYRITTLYYSDGVCVYCDVRNGQTQFMALRATYNADNVDMGWKKKVIIEEEVSE